MKLRLNNNTARLRVTRSEVALIASGENIVETVRFGNARNELLSYILETNSDITTVQCTFKDSTITFSLPLIVARQWAETNQVGVYADYKLEDDTVLKLLIEKDFKCLNAGIDEQPEDKFTNPIERHT